MYIQVITTTATREEALGIGQQLVAAQLVACAQIVGPITSIFRWQGAIQQAEEWQCVLKTRAALYEQVEASIKAMHPYEAPEILALPVQAGSRTYLEWIADETGADD